VEPLNLPASGAVYIDAQIAIYTVERRSAFWARLEPLWQAVQRRGARVVTSERSVMECLIAPMRSDDRPRQDDYDAFFRSADLGLIPVSRPILIAAARLRAKHRHLRMPDAIHFATAAEMGCAMFLTNDAALRQISGVSTTYLGDVIP
jgi:predicted nucleic acid-binding protein